MTDYIVTDTELINVANAIRAKGGTVADLEWPAGYIAAINAIPTGGGVTIVDWATGTDEEIAAMIDAAHNGTIDLQHDGGWAVGDVRTISISEFTGGGNVTHAAQDIDIVITSFDEYMSCGNVMQFDFKDALATGQRMNSEATNVGGYGSTEMKTTSLPALVEALPSWMQSRLKTFSVLASAGNESSTIETVTGNKLALRSEIELFGTVSRSFVGEGSQIAYYATGVNRVKKRGHSGSSDEWWNRSPANYRALFFCNVQSSGTGAFSASNSSLGLAPFGCL